MKVCDVHPARKATDTIHCIGDDTKIDVCEECKAEVLRIFNKPPDESGESPLVPPAGDTFRKALEKRAFSIFGRR